MGQEEGFCQEFIVKSSQWFNLFSTRQPLNEEAVQRRRIVPSEDAYGKEEPRQRPDCYWTARNLPFLMNFSARDRELAEKAFSDQEEQRRKASESRGQEADELIEHLRRQLYDLLGAEKLAELWEAMKHERLSFRDLWQPPVDLHLDHRKENEARKRRLDELVRKLGTNPLGVAK